MANIDDLKPVGEGDEISASQQNIIRQLLMRGAGGPAAYSDGTGVYYRKLIPKKEDGDGGEPDFYILLEKLNHDDWANAVLLDDNMQATNTTARLQDKTLFNGAYPAGQRVFTMHGSKVVIGMSCATAEG